MGRDVTRVNKIPVTISVINGQDGQPRRVPTIPLGEILGRETDSAIQEELNSFNAKYDKLIENCQEALLAISLEKKLIGKVNPLLYWKLGDYINTFVQYEENRQFFINAFFQQLSRDLKLSQSSLRKMLNFHRSLVQREVDTNKSWWFYSSISKGRKASVLSRKYLDKRLLMSFPRKRESR